MTTLTSTSTLSIADAPLVTESVAVTVLPIPSAPSGRGRLIHPSLGTYDYIRGPDEWEGLDGDVLVEPRWATADTMLGSVSTLYQGDIRNVIVEERWVQPTAAELSHFRALLAMYINAPDPSVESVQWWPNYSSALGFNVALLRLTSGPKNLSLSSQSHNGWLRGPIILKMRILGRVT